MLETVSIRTVSIPGKYHMFPKIHLDKNLQHINEKSKYIMVSHIYVPLTVHSFISYVLKWSLLGASGRDVCSS